MLLRVSTRTAIALAGFFFTTGTASAAFLPGSFTTDPIPGTGISINEPEGLAVIGDVLYVVDDASGLPGESTLTSINLTTMAVSQSSLNLAPTLTSMGTFTLSPGTPGTPPTPGSVEMLSLTTGAGNPGGLTFSAGDTFVVQLDNTVGAGTPNTYLGVFDAGFSTLLDFDDNSSLFGNGADGAVVGTVNPDGTINLKITGASSDLDFDGVNDFSPTLPHGADGDFAVRVGIGAAGIASLLDDVEGVAADGGNLWVGGRDNLGTFNAIVVKIDPDTLAVLDAFDLTVTAGVGRVEGLAFDGTHLFVSDNEEIFKIDPSNGSLVSSQFFAGLGIEGLGFDGTHLIAGSENDPEVLLFIDPSDFSIDATIAEAGLPGTSSFDPDGVAFSSAFGIILSDGNEGVQLIATLRDGQMDGRIPEPASLALMGLGLTALGWTRRRRRG